MGEVSVRKTGYRSLFWPIVLIAVGVIWLLGNLGVISGTNLVVLFRLWPLLLIVVGLDLLFGRQSPVIGALIGVGAVVVIIVLMLVGPSIGLGAPEMDITRDSYSESRGDATSATIDLDLSVGTTSIQALTDSSDLFAAEVSHVGTMDYSAEGETQKTIRLKQDDTRINFFEGFGFLGAVFDSEQDLYWKVGLSPDVPIDLTINAGVGESNLDLSQLELSGLDIDIGVGQLDLRLPAADSAYDAKLRGGAGNVTITIADDADLTLDINGGVGNFNIDVPDNAAVRINADIGLGDVTVLGDFNKIGSDTWETSDYSEAARRITIDFEGGVGQLTVQ